MVSRPVAVAERASAPVKAPATIVTKRLLLRRPPRD
jgi:hypothetical protein